MEPLMPSRRPVAILATLSLVTASMLAERAWGEEYQCRRGDLLRRIEVQFADDADRLPCQVLYWRDTESPGRPRVPWNAEHDLNFCINKAREMVDRLRTSGWACQGDEARQSEDAAQLDTAASSKPSSREPDAAAAPAPSGDDATNGSSKPDRAALQAALARDIRRLDQLSGTSSGEFEPQMVALGDLNGDGLADGAALLSHRDGDGGASHHLLVYLFDGKTFQPVARLNLEAYYQNFTEVAIADIADGAIEVQLNTLRAGDQACCPTGRRRATFELKDGKLLLVGESDSGA